MYQGAFGTGSPGRHADPRRAPDPDALCTALPAQLRHGLIGGEGALLIGALSATRGAIRTAAGVSAMVFADGRRGLWIMLAGACANTAASTKPFPACFSSISRWRSQPSGRGRDARPASLNKPSTARSRRQHDRLDPGTDVHWGWCSAWSAVASYILIYHTTFGFAARVAGATFAPPGSSPQRRQADFDDLLSRRRCRGLAGMVEVAAVQGRTKRNSLPATALRASLCLPGAAKSAGRDSRRHLLGALASGGLLQRRLGLPTRPCRCCREHLRLVLASDALYGRIGF